MLKIINNINNNLQNIVNSNKNQALWKELSKEGLLSKRHFFDYLKRSKKEKRHIVEVILEDRTLDSKKILKILSDIYEIPYVLLRNQKIVPATINLLPKEISEQHSVVIFGKNRKKINIALTTPDNKQIIEFIKKKTGLEPKPYLTTFYDIQSALDRHKRNIKEDFDIILNQGVDEATSSKASVENIAQFVPIIKMVNSIIEKGITSNASDIHIEPNLNNVVIRFRVDGIMKKIVELPKSVLPALTTRIKIMSNLKIDEHMLPQDGRFQFVNNGNDYAVRVSIIPTLFGPKIALRVLEMKEKMFTLYKLGLNKIHQKLIKDAITASQGMILVTGPTGSGKTTTLYTVLTMLNNEGTHICTIEDPIEYGIDNINQMQIKPKVGLTFAEGLRALLRQDPNIIMVGEIRDSETANISVNAAMTGHLVLSTLHTNNAFLTPQRMIEMGVQPYLVSSVVNLMVGQRLVRKLCPHCKVKVRSSKNYLQDYENFLSTEKILKKIKDLDLIDVNSNIENLEIYRSHGCNKCGKTGYKGRLGIYEIVPVDNELRKIILQSGSEIYIKNHLSDNTLTMAEDGFLKVLNGVTTMDEVLRVAKT